MIEGATAVANNLRQVGVDAPYRFIASICALPALIGVVPTDAAKRIASWLGFHVSEHIDSVDAWLNDASRRDVISSMCIMLFTIGTLACWGWAAHGMLLSESRGGPTLILAYALAVQTHQWPDKFLLAFIFIVIGLAALAGATGRDGWRLSAVAWDSLIAVAWAPLLLLHCFTGKPKAQSVARTEDGNRISDNTVLHTPPLNHTPRPAPSRPGARSAWATQSPIEARADLMVGTTREPDAGPGLRAQASGGLRDKTPN